MVTRSQRGLHRRNGRQWTYGLGPRPGLGGAAIKKKDKEISAKGGGRRGSRGGEKSVVLQLNRVVVGAKQAKKGHNGLGFPHGFRRSIRDWKSSEHTNPKRGNPEGKVKRPTPLQSIIHRGEKFGPQETHDHGGAGYSVQNEKRQVEKNRGVRVWRRRFLGVQAMGRVYDRVNDRERGKNE